MNCARIDDNATDLCAECAKAAREEAVWDGCLSEGQDPSTHGDGCPEGCSCWI